jgi:hypothetical protein
MNYGRVSRMNRSHKADFILSDTHKSDTSPQLFESAVRPSRMPDRRHQCDTAANRSECISA